MFPGDDLMKLDSLALFGLRQKAVSDKIELTEIGRILYHLNQKRGYKSSRSDANMDKKDTVDYVAEVKGRHEQIKEAGLNYWTILLWRAHKRQFSPNQATGFPKREAYIEEFDTILQEQKNTIPAP